MHFPEARSGVFPFKIHVCVAVVSVATNQDTLRENHVRSYVSNIASVQDTVCDLFVLSSPCSKIISESPQYP
jgi:hypothetical protein